MNSGQFSPTNQPQKTKRSKLTLQQEIAQLEAELSRKREEERQLSNGQKIIIGGMMLALVEADAKEKKLLIERLKKHVTRDADKKRIAPLLQELQMQMNAEEQEQPPQAAGGTEESQSSDRGAE